MLIYEKKREERRVLQDIKSGKYGKEYKEECEYMISCNQIRAIPYKWSEQYRANDIKVYYDPEKNLPYCFMGDKVKKLYFPRKWKKKYIQKYYNSILCEQDKRSPHFYFDTNEEWFDKDTFFIDAGAAEGYATLLIIEKIGKAILLECDEVWMEPLKATFEKWRKKITIVKKYAGNKNDKCTCRIDSFKTKLDKVAIKVDVEGNEMPVLYGAEGILKKKKVLAYVCLYHKRHDEKEIVPYMENHGFETFTKNTYLFYRSVKEKDTTFRHGVLKCVKTEKIMCYERNP